MPGRLHGQKEDQGQELTRGIHFFFPLPANQNRRGKDALGFGMWQSHAQFPLLMGDSQVSYFWNHLPKLRRGCGAMFLLLHFIYHPYPQPQAFLRQGPVYPRLPSAWYGS